MCSPRPRLAGGAPYSAAGTGAEGDISEPDREAGRALSAPDLQDDGDDGRGSDHVEGPGEKVPN